MSTFFTRFDTMPALRRYPASRAEDGVVRFVCRRYCRVACPLFIRTGDKQLGFLDMLRPYRGTRRSPALKPQSRTPPKRHGMQLHSVFSLLRPMGCSPAGQSLASKALSRVKHRRHLMFSRRIRLRGSPSRSSQPSNGPAPGR